MSARSEKATDHSAPRPALSVVIAAPDVDPLLSECLAAYQRELNPDDQLIVVFPGDAPAPDEIAALRSRDSRLQLVHAGCPSLTPRLWALGLAASTGGIVRLGMAKCVPEPGWRATLIAAHARGAAAIGGAIEPGHDLAARDWAVLLMRYRDYLLPFERRATDFVPGDHASYSRAALERTRELWRHDFWDSEINRALATSGSRLELDPALVVRYRGGESTRRFLRERFRHGCHFGRDRLRAASRSKCWLHALAFLLPGVLFLVRIVASVVRKRRLLRLAAGLPWLLAYLFAWSFGEWLGALSRLAQPPEPEP